MSPAIAFDLDGTILNTLADLATSTNLALEAEGLPTFSEKIYRQLVGSGARTLMKRALTQLGVKQSIAEEEAQIERLLKRFQSAYAQHLMEASQPYPGAPEALQQLKQEGCHLAVLTNKPDPFAQQLVSHFFPGIFSEIYGQQAGDEPKPALSYSMNLQRGSGIPLTEWIYVGDSDVDMYTAQNAGMLAVGVSWGFRGEAELRASGAQYLLHSMEEIFTILEQRKS